MMNYGRTDIRNHRRYGKGNLPTTGLSACLCGSYVPERTLTLSLDLLIDRYFMHNYIIGCFASFRDVNHIAPEIRRAEFDSRRI